MGCADGRSSWGDDMSHVAEFRAKVRERGGRRLDIYLTAYGVEALEQWMSVNKSPTVSHAVMTALAQAVRSKEVKS